MKDDRISDLLARTRVLFATSVIKSATLYVAQALRQYRQLGGIQKQIERANQELALINMATIQKQQALTVLMDMIKSNNLLLLMVISNQVASLMITAVFR